MRKISCVCVLLCFGVIGEIARGQGSAPATLSSHSPSPSAKVSPAKTAAEKSPGPKVTSEKDPAEKPKETKTTPAQAIITEIYADQVTFDSAKSIGVFTGRVIVIDPRFNIQGDKLTIFISKAQGAGLDKAIVEGNVGVVRDRPDPAGGPPSRMVGRSEKAVYTASNGNFELTGNPRVQQGINTHVATSPDTVMVLNEAGQLQTTGPSRTEIKQDPNATPTASPKP
ncbi:MAG TPA: LptA/OstA family protein [Chthoniobacterales bacterium]|nr:LptA/OstA family protein [Chthoniobacterales bacterium]